MKDATFWLVLIILLTGCSQQVYFSKRLKEAEVRFKDHIGFVLYDPVSRETLIEHNSAKYFTPASNTKIFTFYTSLNILGDSVPALKYSIKGDSLFFSGTGDPSFLYKNVYQNERVVNFLSSAPQSLHFTAGNFSATYLGPGWAWDDYPYYYSAERSPFPIYGNITRFTLGSVGNLKSVPPVAVTFVVRGDSAKTTSVEREVSSNKFIFHPGTTSVQRAWTIPFHCDPQFAAALLSDTLKKVVRWNDARFSHQNTLYSIPSDSLYKVIMQESDNFIAEQLLLLCAGQLSDTLRSEIAIKYALKNYLFDLPDKPVWVDGSGLSRYNLFTPRSIVRLWEKIAEKVPQERLFKLVAVGGKNGTLKYLYAAETPFIYGKTGSLSNNHALSGFLVTKKGRVLIFSFMNSNFVEPTSEVRKTMEGVLKEVRDRN